MPVLYKYKDRDGYYVLTSISGNIITFQLTTDGEEKLMESDLRDGDRFRRAVLFELYSSGDAYTQGTGPGEIEEGLKNQLAFDFEDDPEPEEIFPACSICSSLDDLNLMLSAGTSDKPFQIWCGDCRLKKEDRVEISIPLPLLPRSNFYKLLQMKEHSNLDERSQAYKDALDKEFHQQWETLIRKPKQKEQTLFGDEPEDGPLFSK